MQLEKYINILKKEYKAKIIEFNDIKRYLSNPEYYGKNFNIYTVSEREIQSDKFITIIIEGNQVDKHGEFLDGTTAIIVFAEYNDDNEVINYCAITSFFCEDEIWCKFLRELNKCKEQ